MSQSRHTYLTSHTTLFAHGTDDDFLALINLKVADIKGQAEAWAMGEA